MLDGRFAEGGLYKCSDVEFTIGGEVEGNISQRTNRMVDLTSLPAGPLAYTEAEFDHMRGKLSSKSPTYGKGTITMDALVGDPASG